MTLIKEKVIFELNVKVKKSCEKWRGHSRVEYSISQKSKQELDSDFWYKQ